MISFNGNTLKCLHEAPLGGPPELRAQRNVFSGVIGVSQIVTGVGGRRITIGVWLTDPSFTTALAVAAYRAQFDSSVGTVADLIISGNAPDFFGDCSFEGFEATDAAKPAIGGAPLLPNGTFWQPGKLSFFQLTPD